MISQYLSQKLHLIYPNKLLLAGAAENPFNVCALYSKLILSNDHVQHKFSLLKALNTHNGLLDEIPVK